MTPQEFEKEWRDGSKSHITVRTSGSTGKPKEIRLPKEMVIASARRTIDFFGLQPGAVLHSAVSPDFIGGKMMAVRSDIINGSLSWTYPPSNEFTLEGDNYDLIAIVPSQLPCLLRLAKSGKIIRNAIVGGAPIPENIKRMGRTSGLNIFETYGMTETASHIALRRISPTVDEFFRPLNGIELSLSPDKCLIITIQNEATLTTNDIATLSADGGFKILGRADNVIITGAKKVHPEELEVRIRELLPDAPDFAITSRPDEKWGEVIVLITSGEEKSFSKLKDILPPHERPREIIKVSSLPRTPNGKISRKELRCIAAE